MVKCLLKFFLASADYAPTAVGVFVEHKTPEIFRIFVFAYEPFIFIFYKAAEIRGLFAEGEFLKFTVSGALHYPERKFPFAEQKATFRQEMSRPVQDKGQNVKIQFFCQQERALMETHHTAVG